MEKFKPVNSMYDKYIVHLDNYFHGCENEFVYVARKEDAQVSRYISENLDFINQVIESLKVRVVYLPMLVERLNDANVQHYWAPYNRGKARKLKKRKVGNDYMLQFIKRDERTYIKQGLIWLKNCQDDAGGCKSNPKTFSYEFFPLSSESDMSLPEQFRQIFRVVWKRQSDNEYYRCCEMTGSSPKDDYADNNFNTQIGGESVDDLIDEIKECVQKLRSRGIAGHILEQLLYPEDRISSLYITKDFKLFLPGFKDMEIKMEPLVKAVFLLFLNHPEGIRFKELPDYCKELTEIYLRMKPNGLTEKVRKSIEDVTNPMSNSINEKCARIRGAFVGQFDNRLAKYYYIDGLRGEPKKISLPRELVVWE